MINRRNQIPIYFLVAITLWLRLVNLGYSDYLGDEIKALAPPAPGEHLADFLFQQRKGPVQFLVTALTQLVNPDYTNEFIIRLPFAIAGILSVYFFYRMVRLHYGDRIALYASIFLSTNGIFVAFSRIVQYQSYVILFAILALYMFSLSWKESQWRITGIYAGMLFWALSMLSHYDGIFIAPFVLYILVQWHKTHNDLELPAKIRHILYAGGIGALLVGGFYLPLFISASTVTKGYWTWRFAGVGNEPRLSSSIVTFRLYNPPLVSYIYAGLGILSTLRIRTTYPILAWFLFPWIILVTLIAVPGTHIYTYLLPTTILIAFGANALEEIVLRVVKSRWGKVLNYAGLTAAFLFLFALAHQVFVDHSGEYPWEPEKFLVWTLGKPNVTYYLWTYGFPYNRHWEEIGEYLETTKNTGYYSSNEDRVITGYYVNMEKDIDKAGHYIHILNPQNFRSEIFTDKAEYWVAKYEPVKRIVNGDKVIAEIYYLPQGSYQEILDAGY